MATLLYRLGAFAVRRRRLVLLTWILLLAVVGGGALAFKGVMTSSFSIPGTQAQQALNQLNAKIPPAGGVWRAHRVRCPGTPWQNRGTSGRSTRCLPVQKAWTASS